MCGFGRGLGRRREGLRLRLGRNEEIGLLADSQALIEHIGPVRIAIDELSVGVSLGRAERGGMVLQQVEGEARIHHFGSPCFQGLETFVEDVLEQEALVLQTVVQRMCEGGTLAPGGFPELGQEDLERRRQG